MTLRVLMTTAILFTATSTQAERHCQGTVSTQEMIFGKLRTLEQPYCLGKPIRHPHYPSWAQIQKALRVQVLEGEGS